MSAPAMTTLFKARVYFYLEPPDGTSGGAVPDRALAMGDESVIGLTESQFLAFLHDAHHRFAVISAPERTNECARRVLETKHPGRAVVLQSVTWLV
jgi:hypothetical protein